MIDFSNRAQRRASTGGRSRVVRRGYGCRCRRSGQNNVGLAEPLSIALSNAILLFVVGCQAHRWLRWQAVRAAIYAMYVCHLWWPRANCGRARRLHEQRRLQACRVCNLRCFVQSSRGGSNDRDDSSHASKPREQAEPLQPALGGPSRVRLNLPATPRSVLVELDASDLVVLIRRKIRPFRGTRSKGPEFRGRRERAQVRAPQNVDMSSRPWCAWTYACRHFLGVFLSELTC